ncbi:MAG TPA: indolepyruvate ferredoxin oxidoreductase family protein [Gammaproteobacteria bacterium]|nr:indolepyruvate ferredoxin oxidoreductase family protein [Gammaproteobacteria bacterium]
MSANRFDMTLEDRFTLDGGWVYMTGMHALVRLPIQQRMRDRLAGLNTAGYISGYRGSPLGRYDTELWKAADELAEHDIVFQPGVNEDLAATAAWGSQYVGMFPGARVDGVFSIWYGKAPGMDRSMDALRHANLAGTSPLGGSLLLVGDDHGANSSTLACYSDFNFASAAIPLLAPSNAQEVLDFGLHGIALSRNTGLLCGMKLVTDVIEGGGSIYVSPTSPEILAPQAESGLGIKTFTPPVEQEEILYGAKLQQAARYCRENGLNRITINSDQARLGIVASGKSYQDLSQALHAMGVSGSELGSLGIRVLKVGMVWPLEEEIVRDFAEGLDTIVVVEEKRPLLEDQIKTILYGTHAPKIIGKVFNGSVYGSQPGETAFANSGEIDPGRITEVLKKAAETLDPNSRVPVPNFPETSNSAAAVPVRRPSFCSGCPHGRSTKLVEGSRALAGIGCHAMAMFIDPQTTNTISHMGGEGAMWLGQAPFTDEEHVFANMGDGTYFHSGFMAIRAAVAEHAQITYKLLWNGAVSMTGGQPVDGELTISQVASELKAEGVTRIAIVADDPTRFNGQTLPAGTTVHPRIELEAVEKTLREIKDVSVLIYEQACATELRRQRKRGLVEDPDRRVFINPQVCEGCGDCGSVSNCMSIEPLETDFGRKRKINQSSCNKDLSCLEGFCPSLVSVTGAQPKRQIRQQGTLDIPEQPNPELPAIDGSFAVLVTGIGGTGVVTVGQTIAVAAHLDGLYSSNLDVTGLAQKYGAVLSHVKIAEDTDELNATRIATAEADTLIGTDVIVSGGDEVISKLVPGKSRGVLATHLTPTADFSLDPEWKVDKSLLISRIDSASGEGVTKIDANLIAERLLGDAVFSNTLLMGAVWQLGSLPVSFDAMMRAVELNGVAVDKNKQAFALGRWAANDLDAVMASITTDTKPEQTELTLEELIQKHEAFLTSYQNDKLAQQYRSRVDQAREAEASVTDATTITEQVARSYFKVLAHKDEWEVARLYTDPLFTQQLNDAFEGDYKIHYHMGAWPFGHRVKGTSTIAKGKVGGWLIWVFRVMATFRFLRGSIIDPFSYSSDVRAAQVLRAQFEEDIAAIIDKLKTSNYEAALQLAALPQTIRGYGHVRKSARTEADAIRQDHLLALNDAPASPVKVASTRWQQAGE